jgi:hypothetical protein
LWNRHYSIILILVKSAISFETEFFCTTKYHSDSMNHYAKY